MDRFDMLLWVSVASDLVVAAVALGGAARIGRGVVGQPYLGVTGLLGAVAATGVVFVAKLVLLGPMGLDLFGVMHLIYLDLAIVVPLLGVTLLGAAVRSRRRPAGMRLSRPVVVVALATLAAPPLAAYASFVAPFALRVEETAVPLHGGSTTAEPRVVVLADLQFERVTDYERAAIARAMALAPDVIVIPGDIFQGSAQAFAAELSAIRALLKPLQAPGGVYLITGNMDSPDRLRRMADGTSLVVLSNTVVRTEAAGVPLAIGGVEDRHSAPSLETVARQLRAAQAEGAWTILLAHRPDVALALSPGAGIDLVIAGHTHGGQVQLPGWGPMIALSRVPRAVAGGGLHALNGAWIYVSRGVGCERGQAPRLRFACPPEVSLLRLRSADCE